MLMQQTLASLWKFDVVSSSFQKIDKLQSMKKNEIEKFQGALA